MMFEELSRFRREVLAVESDLRVRIEACEEMLDDMRDRLSEAREQTQHFKAILEDDEGPFNFRPHELTALEEDMEEWGREMDVMQPRMLRFRELAIELEDMVKWSIDMQMKLVDESVDVEWGAVESKLEAHRDRLDELEF